MKETLKQFRLSDLLLLVFGTFVYSWVTTPQAPIPEGMYSWLPQWTYEWTLDLDAPDPEAGAQLVFACIVIIATTAFIWAMRRGRTLVSVTIASAAWLLSAWPAAHVEYYAPIDFFADYTTYIGKIWIHFAFKFLVLAHVAVVGLFVAAIIHNLRKPK